MPRSQGPPDPDAGPIAEFAHALWELRRSADDPAFRQMAHQAHTTHTSLSRASKGKTFPTWEVTRAYVLACGGDIDEWRPRWENTAKRVESAKRTAMETAPPATGTELVPAPNERIHIPPSLIARESLLVIPASRRHKGAHRRPARPSIHPRRSPNIGRNVCLTYLHIVMLVALATASAGIGLISMHIYLIQTQIYLLG